MSDTFTDQSNQLVSNAACARALEIMNMGNGIVRTEEVMLLEGWDKALVSQAISDALSLRDQPR